MSHTKDATITQARFGPQFVWVHDHTQTIMEVFRGADHPNTIITIDYIDASSSGMESLGIILTPADRRALIAELQRQEDMPA